MTASLQRRATPQDLFGPQTLKDDWPLIRSLIAKEGVYNLPGKVIFCTATILQLIVCYCFGVDILAIPVVLCNIGFYIYTEKKLLPYISGAKEWVLISINKGILNFPGQTSLFRKGDIPIETIDRIRVETMVEDSYPIVFYLSNTNAVTYKVLPDDLENMLEFLAKHIPKVKITKMQYGNRPDIIVRPS